MEGRQPEGDRIGSPIVVKTGRKLIQRSEWTGVIT